MKTYSGGMRRRLDLAASLVSRPQILFLDEPTTGLDPRSRMVTWDAVRALAADGTTVLLTTQHLDEADQLADRIAVVDQGRVIAEGNGEPAEGQDRRRAGAADGGRRSPISRSPPGCSRGMRTACRSTDAADRTIEAPVTAGARRMPEIVRDLDAAGVLLDDLAIRRPSLDDVFLTLTGRSTGTGTEASESEQS